MKQFTLKSLLLVLTILMGGVNAWGEEFSATYSYGSFEGWSLTNYVDESSYYRIPSSEEPSVATISGIFTEKTIISNVVVTLNVATYGSGTNPDASTFSIYNSSSCSEEISATQGGKLPTSKTFTDVTYTIDQQNVSSFTSDLAIKIIKPGKQIRLKSIKVEFSYSAEGEVVEVAPTIDAQPISAQYFQNDDADALSVEVTGYPSPSYQWYSNTSASNEGGTLLSGETNSTYTPSTTEIGTSYYYCVVTNSAGTVTSEVASVVVNPIFEGTKLEMSASQDAQIKFVEGASNENSSVWSLASPNSSNGITLSGKVTSGTNYSYFDGSVVRFYTNNEIIITPSAGVTIGKIEIVRNTSTSSNTGTINCSGLNASKNNTTTNTNVFTGLTTNPITFTASAQARFTAIYVYYISDAVPTPSFSLSSGNIYGTQTLELTTTVENGTILYTTDETDPTTSETALMYKNPIEISETTTIKACVKDADGNFSDVAERTYTFVPSIANTQETAYTVAEAIVLIDNTSAEQLAAEKVYVKGVVSKVDSYSSTYKSITYWLDGNSFKVYSGRALGDNDFPEESGINAVEVGATVVIYGHIKLYNSIYEFDKENYLVTYTAPERASLPATDGTANYATFSSDKNVEFVDATVYAVNVVNGVLQLNEVTSKQVPAGTGVLIKSEKETAPYFYIDEAATIGNNLLKPASEEMSGSYTFYKLAYDDYAAKTGLGFYLGANDGGKFTVKAGTAYLAVPVSNAAGVKGFLLDGTPTVIEGVEAENNTDVIYNLSGQRVQKAQRGLYIVNGKKLMVK